MAKAMAGANFEPGQLLIITYHPIFFLLSVPFVDSWCVPIMNHQRNRVIGFWEVKFLDVSAGTGLASMVGLLRGWHVLSTDLPPESGQARLMSAMASFGQNSSVLDRLQIAELDLFDASTWPSHTTPHAYHVIAGGSIINVVGETYNFELAFRRLVAANLAPRGVGLYTFRFPPEDAEHIGQALPESSTICLWIWLLFACFVKYVDPKHAESK